MQGANHVAVHVAPPHPESTNSLQDKRPDTVGEFKSVEMSVPHMSAWKAKTLGKLTQEKVLLEP